MDQLPTTLYSYLDSNLGAGDDTVIVKNPNPFSQSDAIQIGKTGEAEAEIVVVNAPSVNQLPIAGGSVVLYDHAIDVPVFQIHYNKIIFKRSTSGTAATATPLGTVNITPNSLFTEFEDTSGAATYAYKTQFYNSLSGDLSTESDWFIPGGPTFYSLQKLRQRSKDALYNATYIKDDSIIDDWINEWGEKMNNAAVKANKGYSIGTAQYAIGTAGYGTITEPGFKIADKIEITTDGNNYIPTTEIPMNQYSENDYFSPRVPRHSWEGDIVLRVLPFGSNGTVRLSFGKLNTPLVDDADELPQSFRGYTMGCIEYVLYRAYDNDNKDTQADKHYNRYMAERADFITEITPRDATGPQTIDFAESLTGTDDLL